MNLFEWALVASLIASGFLALFTVAVYVNAGRREALETIHLRGQPHTTIKRGAVLQDGGQNKFKVAKTVKLSAAGKAMAKVRRVK